MKNTHKLLTILSLFIIFQCNDDETLKKNKDVINHEKNIIKNFEFENNISDSISNINARSSEPNLIVSKTCSNQGNPIKDINISVKSSQQYYYGILDPNNVYVAQFTASNFSLDIIDPIAGNWTLTFGLNTMNFQVPITGPYVSAGSSSDFDLYRQAHNYQSIMTSYDMGTGQFNNSSIVDIGIDYENDLVITWYSNGKRSKGTTKNLEEFESNVSYTLPPGYTIANIVGIDLDGDTDKVYTWFSNGKRSVGTSTDLDYFESPTNYSVAPGYTSSDIVSIAIDGTNNYVWTFFSNGKKCAGSTTDLDQYLPLQPFLNFTPACNYLVSDIAAIACDGDNDAIFVWYKN